MRGDWGGYFGLCKSLIREQINSQDVRRGLSYTPCATVSDWALLCPAREVDTDVVWLNRGPPSSGWRHQAHWNISSHGHAWPCEGGPCTLVLDCCHHRCCCCKDSVLGHWTAVLSHAAIGGLPWTPPNLHLFFFLWAFNIFSEVNFNRSS